MNLVTERSLLGRVSTRLMIAFFFFSVLFSLSTEFIKSKTMSVSTVIIVGCGKQNVPMKKFTPRSLDPVNVLQFMAERT